MLQTLINPLRVGIAQSVYRLATGHTIRDSNPGGIESFRTLPERFWGPDSLPIKQVPGLSPGYSSRGVALTNNTASSTDVKGSLESFLYSPVVPSQHVIWTELYFTLSII